jgi:multiple sugar transport system substrate-binding protein
MLSKKRLLVFGVCVLLLVVGFQGEAAKKPDHLTVIVNSERAPMIEVMADQFTKDTDVPVELITQSYDATLMKIITTHAVGTPIDVIYSDIIWVPEFAEVGLTLPLDEFLTPELLSDFGPWLPSATWAGKVMGLPAGISEKRLYYNKDILEKAGFTNPPVTWSELLEMSVTMQELGLVDYGIAFGWAQAEGLVCDYVMFLDLFGGEWRDETGKWIFNEGGGLEALQFMVELVKAGIADPVSVSQNDRTIMNMFAAGNIAFVPNWLFGWLQTQDPMQSKVVGKVGMAHIPGIEEISVSATPSGHSSYAISANTKNKEWAWRLLEYLSSPEAQLMQFELSNYPPTRISMYTDEMMNQYPMLRELDIKPEHVVLRPQISWYTEFSRTLQEELHRALTGAKSVAEALNDAAAWANQKTTLYGN